MSEVAGRSHRLEKDIPYVSNIQFNPAVSEIKLHLTECDLLAAIDIVLGLQVALYDGGCALVAAHGVVVRAPQPAPQLGGEALVAAAARGPLVVLVELAARA